jgi:hypothetical protein
VYTVNIEEVFFFSNAFYFQKLIIGKKCELKWVRKNGQFLGGERSEIQPQKGSKKITEVWSQSCHGSCKKQPKCTFNELNIFSKKNFLTS